MTKPPVLNSLWVGNRLGYLEMLCLRSAVATGHHFRLYSYTPGELPKVPDGVEVRDAAEVMPREKLLFYADSGSVALGANLWRYHLLQKGLGFWCDMDLIFLKPFDFDQPFVFGHQDEKTLNNAVMLAPGDSAFVGDLLEVPQPNRCPPWFGPRRTLLYYFRRFREGHVGLEDMPWGTYGPELVTYLVRKHGLEKFTQPPTVFYPVPWRDARVLYDDAEKTERMLSDQSRAIHMWHGRLGELKASPPPEGSYIGKMCEALGVDTSGR